MELFLVELETHATINASSQAHLMSMSIITFTVVLLRPEVTDQVISAPQITDRLYPLNILGKKGGSKSAPSGY